MKNNYGVKGLILDDQSPQLYQINLLHFNDWNCNLFVAQPSIN